MKRRKISFGDETFFANFHTLCIGEIEGREKSTWKEGSGKSLQLAALDLIDLLDGWNKVAFLSLFYG